MDHHVTSMRAGGLPPVLVLGCGRSGTSIFGELFDALPGYRYRSEPRLEELADEPLTGLATKVPHVDPALGPQERFDRLRRALADPVVLWVVRHPLDAICSLRVGIADGWGHHPRPPDWQDWVGRPLVERCAHHWATINTVEWAVARPSTSAVVRFEDLIADPEGVARRTASLLGTDADDPAVAAWWRRVRDRDDEQFVEAQTSRRRSRPDHSVRVGRWRENLDAADVEAILPIVRAAAADHGYDLPSVAGTAGG